MESSLTDLKDPFLYRAVFAEAIGTLLLVFVGCGSCLGKSWADYNPSLVQIALCFGLAVATVVWCIAHVSGGHINPAVTVGFLVARKISLLRAIFYVVAQCGGATVGAALLKVLTPVEVQGSLGMTTVNGLLTVGQGFGVELIITFILVFTVFASCDANRTDLNGSIPLSIGFSITLCHLFAIKYTGSSMNPARTLGPAVITGKWDNHWVYWCGPLLGGAVAAALYETVFAEDASLAKAKRFFLKRNYSEESVEVQEDLPEEKNKAKKEVVKEVPEEKTKTKKDVAGILPEEKTKTKKNLDSV